ncbi:MAG: hypothetical protein V1725_07680 [archaeon]
MIKDDEYNVVHLSTLELRLFNFLRGRSADTKTQPTFHDIQEFLSISPAKTKRIITSLGQREGISIHTETKKKKNETKTYYSLSPEALDILVRAEPSMEPQHDGYSYSALYIAEPAFGTKVYDPLTLKGLSLFLDVNNISRTLDEVVFQGGVIPHVPPYTSESYKSDLRFLGYVPRNVKDKGLAEVLLEERLENDSEQEFYERHINNLERRKITSLTDAFMAAEEQIVTLMDTLPEDTVVRIQFGEEDRKNMRHIEETYLKQWAKEKAIQIKMLQEEQNAELAKAMLSFYLNDFEKKALEDARKKTSLLRNKKEGREAYYARVKPEFDELAHAYLEKIPSDIKLDKSVYETTIRDVLKFLYWARNAPDQAMQDRICARVKKLEGILEREEERKEEVRFQNRDLIALMSWTERLLGERREITWFTKQYPAMADEVELVFKKAKEHYKKHFLSWTLKQPLVTHTSPRKLITVDTELLDVKTGKKDTADVEYELIRGEKKILLVHNINNIFSDSVKPSSIRDAKLELNYQNMVLHKLYDALDEDNRPDIILLGGHAGGGFRVMPWFKESEHLISGQFVKDQGIAYLINLPTLQSVSRLEWAVNHNFRNWHTKRYKAGPYGSAAVLHTEDDRGVNRFTVIDTSQLIRYGKIAEEIDSYRAELAKENITDGEKERLIQRIQGRKDEAKIAFKRIEAAGDFHLGTSNDPDRYSASQMIRAMMLYQEMHGLPDYFCWDEVLHGTEKRIFESAARYEGHNPESFRTKIVEKILADTIMTPVQKLEELARQSLINLRAITVHNISEQKHMFKLLLKPYAQGILAAGGRGVLMSGNHANKSEPTADEAIELSLQFDEHYLDDKRLYVLSGKGNDVGVGTIVLEGGQKLFAMHKFPTKQDEVYGILHHLLRSNNDADIVIAGDRHQPGVGYADGHIVVLHPGMEPMNKYVPLIGKPAGVRGFNNIYFDPNQRGVYAVEFIVNNTLQDIIEQHKLL